ncbi:oxygen-sensing cyclic-di-GMP phosphodiesterase DosP [Telmatospirillum sp. J64-1]|uniref:oxygen-sensing cyclic-di-GMP phosphodiesterase DosP n=1 Tax=Telmatospirillum sp. J64-1 TaxID=2502183 RepID=UPI00115EE898|nr:oxygen-sensing cyclic-di-GMP phosphodiesterase DosP [Telmatospirillum sp. J64-1]
MTIHHTSNGLDLVRRHDLLWPALEQAIHAAVLIDSRNTVIFFNAAAERLWGYDRQEVLGRSVDVLVPAPLRQAHRQSIEDNRRTGQNKIVGTSRELEVERKDGSRIWVSFSLSKVATDDGIYYLGFLRDITREVLLREERRLLSLAVDETGKAVLILDHNRDIVYVNQAFTDLFGYTATEVMGRRPSSFLASPATDPADLQRLQQGAWGNTGFQEEILAAAKDGRELWVSASINPIAGPEGEMRNVVAVLSDITESRQLRSLQQEMLAALTSDLSLDGLLDFLCRRIEVIAPGLVAAVFLRDAEESLALAAGPSLPEDYRAAIRRVPIGPEATTSGLAAFLGRPLLSEDVPSDPRWQKLGESLRHFGIQACWASPIKRADGRVMGSLTFYFPACRPSCRWHEEIALVSRHLCLLAIERHESRERLMALARFDSLTGLPNRAALLEKARALTTRPEGAGDIAFLSIGVDNLQDINETLGHAAGDTLLIAVSNLMHARLEPKNYLGRFGGDAFLMILNNTSLARTSSLAERILAELAAPLDIGGQPVTCSASIGIAFSPANGGNGEDLLCHANVAMQRARTEGRGRPCFYSPAMARFAQDRMRLSAALREAIRQEQLRFEYHPLVRPLTGEIHGVEALARWTHPELGIIPPDRFIPLAEETGQIEALGNWALREVCRQMAEWRARGIDLPTVAVNLSPLHFRNKQLPLFLTELLCEYRLPGHCLKVEITENAMMDGEAETLETLHRIRALGVGLSMDDFGTGFSSLSRLAKLPVTELKIDRSFMRDIDRNPNARAIAMAVIRIGQSLDMTVIAEGVETEDQRQFLIDLGCQVAQGYLYTKPLPPAELELWLRRHRPFSEG